MGLLDVSRGSFLSVLRLHPTHERSTVILSLSITGAITQFSKITVGRPRPGRDLLMRV